jgi:surface antigen
MRITKLVKASALFAMLSLALTSCQPGTGGQNTAVGAGIGAMVGGLGCAAIGGKVGTCLAIAGAGALIGGSIGAQIDARDRAYREAALRQARVQKKRVSWRNPQTGNSGTITPLRGVIKNGSICQNISERYVRKGEPPLAGQETTC